MKFHPITLRVGAAFMIVWVSLIWPLQWHQQQAFASDFPNSDESKLINQREQLLGRGLFSNPDLPIRAPKVGAYVAPIRTPKMSPSDHDHALAEEAARDHAPLSVGDIVKNAQSAHDFSEAIYSTANVQNYHLDLERPSPGENNTRSNTVNLHEVMPGYNQEEFKILENMGADVYHNPDILHDYSVQKENLLRRAGCRETKFRLLDRQNINLAEHGADHRILKVEFYELIKTPISGTSPTEYEIKKIPTTYKASAINIEVETLGGVASEWWEALDDNHVAHFVYTPYSNPKNSNYFTYRHQIRVDTGYGSTILPDSFIASYGSPEDGFKTVLSADLLYYATAIYLSADLYKTEVNYREPSKGATCPADPPAICEVPSLGGGDVIRWCAGSPGANIFFMYDDKKYPSSHYIGKDFNNLSVGISGFFEHEYESDAEFYGGIIRGLTADKTTIADEMAGMCYSESAETHQVEIDSSYYKERINICSETLINPYPEGCHTVKRSFGLSLLGRHTYLTVSAFNKVAHTVIDPKTGAPAIDPITGEPIFTYSYAPTNVKEEIETEFPVFGVSYCENGVNTGVSSGIKCSTEPEGEGYFVKYNHTPFGGSPYKYAVNGIYIDGGTGYFGHYGFPSDKWLPSGHAQGSNTQLKMQLSTDIHAVISNTFAGCENYLNYIADNMCKGGEMVCLDRTPTRTVGTVTFGPGMANEGILDLLTTWGVKSTAEFPEGDDTDPTPTGPEIVLIDDPMCWEAYGKPFTTCETMASESLPRFMRDGEIWSTDCDITAAPDGTPITSSTACRRAPSYDECDSTFYGLFTDRCYNRTIAYDCGEEIERKVPVSIPEKINVCTGEMRCMGTECHRPNLAGSNGEDFARAVSGMEALNMMKMDMVCAETGKPPSRVPDTITKETVYDYCDSLFYEGEGDPSLESCCRHIHLAEIFHDEYSDYIVKECTKLIEEAIAKDSDVCTPLVFGGTSMYCKIPIGNSIGLTPQCCRETQDAVASSGPNWAEYLMGTYLVYKITENSAVQSLLANSDIYNSTAKIFGEIASPVTSAYHSASTYVTKNFVEPLGASFDNLFGKFGAGGESAAAASDIAVDSSLKSLDIFNVISTLKQKMMEHAYLFLEKMLGEELASKIIEPVVVEGVQQYQFGMVASSILAVYQVYTLLKLIGHIVFACKEEEYEWAMSMKWRLCSYAGSCCSKKLGLGNICVEKRKLYCCYKSIAARVVAEQIIKKGLMPSRTHGYRSGKDGSILGKCNINCGGFTPHDLAEVDWAKVDLSEWFESLVNSGLATPHDPSQDYGVDHNTVEVMQAVGRTKDTEGLFNQEIPAVKTVEGMSKNISTISEYTTVLRRSGHCYDADERKMPYTYPECVVSDP